jgi:hypothetical protein
MAKKKKAGRPKGSKNNKGKFATKKKAGKKKSPTQAKAKKPSKKKATFATKKKKVATKKPTKRKKVQVDMDADLHTHADQPDSEMHNPCLDASS